MTPAPVIIAVDGRSGAGKTTLAVELAARLRQHHKVSLFHLEDIYPGWNGLMPGIERYVGTVLTPLSSGQAAEWTSWDWERHYDGGLNVTLPAEIVIVEGVGAAADAARSMLDAVVWVESPGDDRRRRALARDGSTYEPYWDSWAAQEDEWLSTDQVIGAADIRVQNLADGNAPEDVLQALMYLPSVASILSPELSARRGLQLRSERLDAVPDAALLFESLYARSAQRCLARFLQRLCRRRQVPGRRPQPLQHPGRRRRHVRPVGAPPFRDHPQSPRVPPRSPPPGRSSAGSTPSGAAGPSARPAATTANSRSAGSDTSATSSNAKPAATMSPPTPRTRHCSSPDGLWCWTIGNRLSGCSPWKRPTPTSGSARPAPPSGLLRAARLRLLPARRLPVPPVSPLRRRRPRIRQPGLRDGLQAQDRGLPARNQRRKLLRDLPDHHP